MDIEVVKHNRPIMTVSAMTVQLASYLRDVPVGAIAPYDELSRVIGANVQKVAYGWLFSARKMLRREDRMVFEPVRGVGLKRLTDEEKVKIGSVALTRINRTSKRAIEKTRCIDDITKLSSGSQLQLYTTLSLLNVFFQVSRGTSIKKIENVISHAPGELELNAVLGALITSTRQPNQSRMKNVPY